MSWTQSKCIGRTPGMADFQFQPNTSDPVSRLRSSMDCMDGELHIVHSMLKAELMRRSCPVEGILKYSIPEEQEDYTIEEESGATDFAIDPQLRDPEDASSSATPNGPRIRSNLRLPPPPLFSRQAVPQIYKYAPRRLQPVHSWTLCMPATKPIRLP